MICSKMICAIWFVTVVLAATTSTALAEMKIDGSQYLSNRYRWVLIGSKGTGRAARTRKFEIDDDRASILV